MKKNYLNPAYAAMAGLAAVLVMVAMNQDRQNDVEDRIRPVIEIIQFGKAANGYGKFDTRTGAIWQYNGDAMNSSVRGQWVMEVKGVSSRPAGSLRLQHADGPALFMIDAATGESWILHKRASNNWSWDKVRDFR